MQSTVPQPAVATMTSLCRSVTPESLAAAFHALTDPRRQASVTYPVAAVLTLTVVAILANQTSVLAIAEWGRRQPQALLARLGFPDGRTPCQSTLQRLFAKLDGHALSMVLTEHFAVAVRRREPAVDLPGVAIDGKAQRGRLLYDPDGSAVHVLTAFEHATGIVLAQEPIEHGAEKSEAELTVAPALITRVANPGRVITGDALFCQRNLCQQIVDAGADYLFVVRANQPTLHEAVAFLFDPPAISALAPSSDYRETRTVERGHGRHEVRHLRASTELTVYLTQELGWPGVAQVFRLERTWHEHGQSKQQILYGITSLTPEAGPPERLLALKRGHWQIENALHWTKDVTLGEDRSLIHAGQGPIVMAELRDTVISVLHCAGVRRIAARLREFSQFPERGGLSLGVAHGSRISPIGLMRERHAGVGHAAFGRIWPIAPPVWTRRAKP